MAEAIHPPPRRAPVPVLCVGAAVAGGAGKTPVVLSIEQRIRRRWPTVRVGFLTRGYGGRQRSPLRVDLSVHTAKRVSDEGMLLARAAPTWVCANRWEGAMAACASEQRPTVLIMDDGLQHHTLWRDLSLLVIDADYLVGNGRVLPAGPLREPFARALTRADALVALSPIADGASQRLVAPPSEEHLRQTLGLAPAMPIIRAALQPEPEAARRLAGTRVVAFSATARPERFFRALRSLGCRVCETLALPDHAPVPPEALQRLRCIAVAEHARLVTTSKDAARMSAAELQGIGVLPVQVEWDEAGEERLDMLIEGIFAQFSYVGASGR